MFFVVQSSHLAARVVISGLRVKRAMCLCNNIVQVTVDMVLFLLSAFVENKYRSNKR